MSCDSIELGDIFQNVHARDWPHINHVQYPVPNIIKKDLEVDLMAGSSLQCVLERPPRFYEQIFVTLRGFVSVSC